MPGLLIKNLPDELHSRLKTRAAANRRSLSSETIVILEHALDDRAGPPTLEEIDKMRVRGLQPLTHVVFEDARKSGRI